MNKKKDPIFEILKKQEMLINQLPVYYVHYDISTRRILSFRNYLEKNDENPFLKITEKDIEIPIEEFEISNYLVMTKEKKTFLEKIKKEEAVNFGLIDDIIFQIPKIEKVLENEPYDLLIEQNNDKGAFFIKLSNDISEKYKFLKVDKEMYMYVTAPDDPNILYKTLKFNISDLVNTDYHKIKFEDFLGQKSNIYSLKYFQDYLHVDTRNDKIGAIRN